MLQYMFFAVCLYPIAAYALFVAGVILLGFV